MTDDLLERAKQEAGRSAARFVEDGMAVGLGTGSTVHWTIVALGERGANLRCVATSRRTEQLARSVGLTVAAPDELGALDIAIDGADEVDDRLNLVKGAGGAHTREKIVAEMAERFVVVVDDTKLVSRLGRFGVALEVLDFAPGVVVERVRALGATDVRPAAGGSGHTGQNRTDNGNLLFRAWFGEIGDPAHLAARLSSVPGIVEHGVFLAACVERVVVGATDGSLRELVNGRA
jgi:ribose 5-phosphate isomerase A